MMHEFHYGRELKAGWLAVTNSKESLGFGITFPKEILNTIYFWLNYGFWRGCHNMGLYPMSGYPATLQKAAEAGTCSHLGPGESLECEVRMVAYTGLSRVTNIDSNGKVS